MEESTGDSPSKTPPEESNSSSNSGNGVSTTSEELPLAFADVELSLPSSSEENRVSQLTALPTKSNRAAAAAAEATSPSSHQSWRQQKRTSDSGPEDELEQIRDVVAPSDSAMSDDAANLTLPSDLMGKFKQFNIDDVDVDDALKECTIVISDCSDIVFLENSAPDKTTNNAITPSSDEEASHKLVVLKHRDSVLLAKKDLTNMRDGDESPSSSFYEVALTDPESVMNKTETAPQSMPRLEAKTRQDSPTAKSPSPESRIRRRSFSASPSKMEPTSESSMTYCSDDSLVSSSSYPKDTSMTRRRSPRGHADPPNQLSPSPPNHKQNRSRADSVSPNNKDFPRKNSRLLPPRFALPSPEGGDCSRSVSPKNKLSTRLNSATSSPSSSPREIAPKDSGLSPKSLIGACSVVFKRYNSQSSDRSRSFSPKDKPSKRLDSASSSPNTSTKQGALKCLGGWPRLLAKACSVVLERYNPFRSTKVSFFRKRPSIDIPPEPEAEKNIPTKQGA